MEKMQITDQQILNPAHVEALRTFINQAPYFRLLGMSLLEIGQGKSRMELRIDAAKHLNPFGGLHGGVYASLIDAAAYWAAYFALPEEDGMISADLSVNNLARSKGGQLFVEGHCLKTGHTLSLSEAFVRDAEGRLLAHGLSKLLVKSRGLQSVSQAIAAAGLPPLPPKFIA
ncbi:MAG: PaaI family thioesterase [Tannerella sp.]|jgi:uncharacterized protein (TIGR00369 family)|nr:PaaI family thioesterase [Tannerella sp.]